MEVLVHDDASNDSTSDVLAAFDDSRLRIKRHATRLGVAANRNGLVADARGRYIAWLDSDDSYVPGSLARRLAMFDEHQDVGLVHGGFELIDDHGEQLRSWPAAFQEDTILPSKAAFRELLASNSITTSTVVVRRSAQLAAGGFEGSIGNSSTDWDRWLRIALGGDVAYTAAPVARYRQHNDTISHDSSASGERLNCDVRVVKRILREERRRIRDPHRAAAEARAALAAKALYRAGDLYTSGQRRESIRAIVLAARLAPRAAGPGALKLLAATARGDDFGCYRATKNLMTALAEHAGPTRYAANLAASSARDPLYEAALVRAAKRIRELTPTTAIVATVTKWDPSLLWMSRRDGVQFPDRRQMPDGYPRSDDALVRHLALLRSRGVTHIAFTAATFWWLDHYTGFAAHLADNHRQLHRDADCAIFDLRATPAA